MSPKPTPAKKAPSTRPDGVVTLEQVAELAGVSPSTVSRILNGTAAVSQAKKDAVEAAIQELGFRPNPVARGLAGGKTLSVGVVTQIISSPFYGEALLGIERELERAGYVPLFVSGNWHEDDERKAIETLLSRRVDGVIVLAGRISDAELIKVSDTLPVVVVGRQLSGPQLFSFSFDNRTGARLATQHLIDQGHRRIAFVAGDLMHDDAVERQNGYFEALAAAGIPVDQNLIVQSDYTEAGGMLSVTRLLERDAHFTALFASNDQMAIGACLGLHRRNLRVPDDVSLVGFDDLIMARYSMPVSYTHLVVYKRQAQAGGPAEGGREQVATGKGKLVSHSSESAFKIVRQADGEPCSTNPRTTPDEGSTSPETRASNVLTPDPRVFTADSAGTGGKVVFKRW